jgi:aminoglycoside phosphotransferase (APT) family kinase protein
VTASFDVGALERFLSGAAAGFRGPLTIWRFGGGQSNPTFLLKGGGKSYVLRKKPEGPLLPSAHAIEGEHRVMSALKGSGVPTPATLCLYEDATILGTPFFVMEHVEGRIFWDPTLPTVTPAERAAIYDDMNRVIARLPGVDIAAIGLSDFGRPGHYLERQIGRWSKQYLASQTHVIEPMLRLIEWAAQASSAAGRDGPRPWRPSRRQYDHSSPGAASGRPPRLGTPDAWRSPG